MSMEGVFTLVVNSLMFDMLSPGMCGVARHCGECSNKDLANPKLQASTSRGADYHTLGLYGQKIPLSWEWDRFLCQSCRISNAPIDSKILTQLLMYADVATHQNELSITHPTVLLYIFWSFHFHLFHSCFSTSVMQISWMWRQGKAC